MRPETQNVINAKNDLDDLMASQSVRSCTMLSPMELVQSLAPFALNGIELADKSTDGLTMSTDDHGTASATTQIQESKSLTVQPFVVIDVRSAEESVESGAGMLPRAIQLEPSFLDRPDAFEVWLQHFDGTRGCHICVVDMPPAILPGVALWRRLLLGEGMYSYCGYVGFFIRISTITLMMIFMIIMIYNVNDCRRWENERGINDVWTKRREPKYESKRKW
jgi:hypothetical protein